MEKTKTLEQTIARYYQLGKTPVRYKTDSVTEAMMSFYLANKYSFTDPQQYILREQYRAYKTSLDNSRRLRPSKPISPPDLMKWELNVDFDKTNRKGKSQSKTQYVR